VANRLLQRGFLFPTDCLLSHIIVKNVHDLSHLSIKFIVVERASNIHLKKICAQCSTHGLSTLHVTATSRSALCPLCAQPVTRLHGWYRRVVKDLPCAGQQVQLILHVRKFFCDTANCARKVFAERLSHLLAPWAQMTTRLCQALQTIGLATCGRLGARLASHPDNLDEGRMGRSGGPSLSPSSTGDGLSLDPRLSPDDARARRRAPGCLAHPGTRESALRTPKLCTRSGDG
jgi:hypothetical protein